jgi:hypothetical protein
MTASQLFAFFPKPTAHSYAHIPNWQLLQPATLVPFLTGANNLRRNKQMKLESIASGSQAIPIFDLGLDEYKDLVTQTQARLGDLGLLDPPSDGLFGQVSKWALLTFKEMIRTHTIAGLDPKTASFLLPMTREELFPILVGNDLAGRTRLFQILNK